VHSSTGGTKTAGWVHLVINLHLIVAGSSIGYPRGPPVASTQAWLTLLSQYASFIIPLDHRQGIIDKGSHGRRRGKQAEGVLSHGTRHTIRMTLPPERTTNKQLSCSCSCKTMHHWTSLAASPPFSIPLSLFLKAASSKYAIEQSKSLTYSLFASSLRPMASVSSPPSPLYLGRQLAVVFLFLSPFHPSISRQSAG
jgi:hypothetical protein